MAGPLKDLEMINLMEGLSIASIGVAIDLIFVEIRVSEVGEFIWEKVAQMVVWPKGWSRMVSDRALIEGPAGDMVNS